ncbi:protein Abitram-like [Ixodes scapularis]|uniref:protein Abitram-like n=1 Tax=Ixodes scapularis TaxID=6945 RepID=UPI001A9E4C20|nr:protein Abitram-like [Ixodes scapularis]
MATQSLLPSEVSLRLGQRISSDLPSVTERYFKPRFLLDASGQKGEDQCALFHSNRIVLVTLAPSHPILREGKTATKVNFQVNEKLNRLSNQVSGKWKRGGQKLQKESAMCIVSCADGSEYTLVSTVPGALMEVNDRLTTAPELLTQKPWSSGYIAIVLPPMKLDTMLLDTMVSPDSYVQQRQDSIPDRYLTAEKMPDLPATPLLDDV